MVSWEVGWLSKLYVLTEVFHSGSVLRMVCRLMYQGLDALELGICLMFSPGKDRERLTRYFGEC